METEGSLPCLQKPSTDTIPTDTYNYVTTLYFQTFWKRQCKLALSCQSVCLTQYAHNATIDEQILVELCHT
jgi:hypothetical protein